MKSFLLQLILIISFLVGCSSNSRLGNPKYLPDDWFSISINSWQYKELPEANKVELQNFKIKLANERQGQYFSFYQKYSPKFQSEIDTTISSLNEAYFNQQYSSKAILANLTPELDGTSETHSERDAGVATVNNLNQRMGKDDVNRALLLDKPSMLSPYPVSDH